MGVAGNAPTFTNPVNPKILQIGVLTKGNLAVALGSDNGLRLNPGRNEH